MKTILIIICILFTSSVFAQTRKEERRSERKARKESRHVYRVYPLEGANYPKGIIKPSTVKLILVSFFVGVAIGHVAYEEGLRIKKQ